MPLLTVERLKKSYRRGLFGQTTTVLNDLNFTVQSGSITGFLGANGAGKTTTMRCILDLDFADEGEVRFFGSKLDLAAKAKIGFLPEHPYFYRHLSGVEFLEFYANLSRAWKPGVLRDRIQYLLKRVDLEFAQHRQLASYSKGMLQKIGVAQALIHEPELVILDEPMSGLDPDGRFAISEIIRDISKGGQTVFFSTHLLHDTEKICNELVMIRAGKQVFQGRIDLLLRADNAPFELLWHGGGQAKTEVLPSEAELQVRLSKILSEGGAIVEIRRAKVSLEEVFVRLAMRESET